MYSRSDLDTTLTTFTSDDTLTTFDTDTFSGVQRRTPMIPSNNYMYGRPSRNVQSGYSSGSRVASGFGYGSYLPRSFSRRFSYGIPETIDSEFTDDSLTTFTV